MESTTRCCTISYHNRVLCLIAVFLTFLTAARSERGLCYDQYPADVCTAWRLYGSCENNQMTRIACKETCGVCKEYGDGSYIAPDNVICKDLDDYDCAELARSGFCNDSFTVRTIQCRKSCNNCELKPEIHYGDDAHVAASVVTSPLTTIDVSGCEDFDREACAFWAKIGYCEKNRKLREICKISCGICP